MAHPQPSLLPAEPADDTTETTRLEAFSDGVFAIAVTLLALDLPRPDGPDLWRELGHAWESYAAFLVSFLTIGIIWVNHHECVSCMDRVDRTMLFINILLLMVVAFIPFPTKLVADHLQNEGEHAAVYAYDLTLALMSLVFNLWWRYACTGRRLIRED
ncbi:MAG TPA: TMEM175 family protein, partial [Thermoanaerobaculia bacterium]